MARPDLEEEPGTVTAPLPARKLPPGLASTALLILSGNTLASIMTFARNLLIARLISLEDYGIAATFAIAVTAAEMASAFGVHQLVIQAKEGARPRFQATLQAFNLARGLFSAALLLIGGQWIADFMGLSHLGWAFRTLALVPIFNGLIHYDIFRYIRKMQFLPSILATNVPGLVTLCMVWPLSMIFADYRISLVVTVSHFFLMMLVSHLVATRRYRLRYDRAIVTRAFHFGWPLVINNFLLFAIFNGERTIVGHQIGMAELGVVAMGLTLTLTPVLILSNTVQRFFMPQLSAAQDDPERFRMLCAVVCQVVLMMASLFFFCVVVLGEPVVMLLLGERYAPLVALLPLLGMMQFLRALQIGTAVIPLAQGQTRTETIANLVRVAILPLSWYVATHGVGLEIILAMAIGAECLSLTTLIYRMHRRIGLPFGRFILPAILAALAAALMLAYTQIDWVPAHLSYGLTTTIAIVLIVAILPASRDLRQFVTQWPGKKR